MASNVQLKPQNCSLLLFVYPQKTRSTLFPYTTLFRSERFASMRGLSDRSPPPTLGLADGHADTVSALRSEEHTSEFQSHRDLVCRLLLEKKNSMKPHNCSR